MTPAADLLARLEGATESSMALSRMVARYAGWHRVEPQHCSGKHGAWISPDEFRGTYGSGRPVLDSMHGTTMHRDPPDFTGSIDAKLPWENIERVALDETVWVAWHVDPDRRWWMGSGAAEPLARRAAALRARAEQE